MLRAIKTRLYPNKAEDFGLISFIKPNYNKDSFQIEMKRRRYSEFDLITITLILVCWLSAIVLLIYIFFKQ